MHSRQLSLSRPLSVPSVLTFVVSLLLASTGRAAPDIIGGIEISSNHPHASTTVAVITLSARGQGICTGSLIASDLVVTAAHCVTEPFGSAVSPQQVFLVFGVDTRLVGSDSVRTVAGLAAHPDYRGVFSRGSDQKDIALLHFKGGLPSGFRPAKLLPTKIPLKNGMSTTLVGYGVSTQDPVNGGDGAGVLREVAVKIHNRALGRTEVILDQTRGKGACHGDSGGPAFVKVNGSEYLWGVTNRGYPDTAPDDCAHYSVYTKINSHAIFLNGAIRSLRQVK